LEIQGRGKCTQCPVAGDANESTRLGSKIHRKLWPYGARRPDSARRSSACAWNGWAGVGSTCAPAATRTSGRERERSDGAGGALSPGRPAADPANSRQEVRDDAYQTGSRVTTAPGQIYLMTTRPQSVYRRHFHFYDNACNAQAYATMHNTRIVIDTLSILCGAGSMKRSSVRPSVRPSVCPSVRPAVCPIDRQQQWRVAGLLLNAPRAGDIDSQQMPARSSNGIAARRPASNAGSVTLTAVVGGSVQTCYVCTRSSDILCSVCNVM